MDKYKFNEIVRNELRQELKIEDKFVIGHIGRFCYAKNHDFLIDVFYEVSKKKDNAILMLIGVGELEEEVKNKVKNLGIEDKVLFLGKKNDAYRYYQAMDLFLFPSKYEGLGMVSIEAQASGLPVICSTSIPSEAKVTDLVSYLSLQDGIEKWVDVVIDTYSNYSRRDTSEEVRNAGFDIRTEAVKLLEYYEELLK